jgi:Tfp pilus assembly protein PilN
MNLRSKTSLGIDICDDRINVALLRKHSGEIKLAKSASAPVPEGAITNGNITNPGALAGAIRQLLAQSGTRRQPTVVSLVAKPVLTQTIDLPDNVPENIGLFINAEIKHSPVLAGREPYYDYCGLGSTDPEKSGRVFVAATDNEKIFILLKTMSLAGIEPWSIELDITAATRALYTRRIAEKYDHNLLLGLIRSSVMTLCVFRKGQFDFIRNIDLGADADDPDKLITRCESEFSAVIQFYDIEVEPGSNTKWEFVVVPGSGGIEAQDLEFSLQKKFGVEAHVCSSSTLEIDTIVETSSAAAEASLVAVGLAMKRFEASTSEIQIDMVPPEVKERKISKRLMLLTANVAAGILLLMLLIAGVVRVKLAKIGDPILDSKQANPVASMELLLERKNLIDAKIAELSAKRAKISEIFEGDNTSNWSEILDDIRYRMPVTLCITRLSCPKGSSLEIDGESLSYRAAHLFAELLGKSEFIKSAAVAVTNQNSQVEGLISYSINCELADRKGITANVDG